MFHIWIIFFWAHKALSRKFSRIEIFDLWHAKVVFHKRQFVMHFFSIIYLSIFFNQKKNKQTIELTQLKLWMILHGDAPLCTAVKMWLIERRAKNSTTRVVMMMIISNKVNQADMLRMCECECIFTYVCRILLIHYWCMV